MKRRQHAAIECRGEGGAACVGDLGVVKVELPELRQHTSRRRQRSWLGLASARAKENAPAELPAKVHPLAKRHKLADAVAAATATATRASKGLKASRLDWMAQWLKQSDEEKVHWHSWFEAEMVRGLGYIPSWVSRSG